MDGFQKSISLPANAEKQFSFLHFFPATIAIPLFSLKTTVKRNFISSKKSFIRSLNSYPTHNEMI